MGKMMMILLPGFENIFSTKTLQTKQHNPARITESQRKIARGHGPFIDDAPVKKNDASPHWISFE